MKGMIEFDDVLEHVTIATAPKAIRSQYLHVHITHLHPPDSLETRLALRSMGQEEHSSHLPPPSNTPISPRHPIVQLGWCTSGGGLWKLAVGLAQWNTSTTDMAGSNLTASHSIFRDKEVSGIKGTKFNYFSRTSNSSVVIETSDTTGTCKGLRTWAHWAYGCDAVVAKRFPTFM